MKVLTFLLTQLCAVVEPFGAHIFSLIAFAYCSGEMKKKETLSKVLLSQQCLITLCFYQVIGHFLTPLGKMVLLLYSVFVPKKVVSKSTV